MVDTVTGTQAATQSTKTSNSSQQIASDFDDFLTLLTTQLQNQDPLSPMDSTQFTEQLIGFAGVEQQINMNSKLDDLLNVNLSNTAGMALGYVGLEVSYPDDQFHFDGENPVRFAYQLESAARVVKVNILDEDGDVVASLDAPTGEGLNEFKWDGKNTQGDIVEEGNYTFRVDALDTADEAIKSSVGVYGIVQGVTLYDGVVYLNVNENAVPLSVVNTAGTPKKVAATTDTTSTGTDTGTTTNTTTGS